MVPTAVFTLHSWNSATSGSTIENEEWLAFLQRNMEVSFSKSAFKSRIIVYISEYLN